jgi:hypothetical protein
LLRSPVDDRREVIDKSVALETTGIRYRIKRACEPTNVAHILAMMAMAIIFLLGVGNFALHTAVLDSGHRLLGQSPWYRHLLGGRVTLVTEFLLLFAALLLAAQGWQWVSWAYLAYSALNGIGGWLILTGRV